MIPDEHTLSEERARRHEAEAAEFAERVFDELEAILAEVPDEDLQVLVYRTAFSSDPPAAKHDRPRYWPCYQATVVYRALADDPSDTDVRRLVQFGLAATEYSDLLDDVMDGDVDPEYVPHVLVTTQTLHPIMMDRLAAMGSRALDDWTEQHLQLVQSPFVELERELTAETYLEMVEQLGYYTGHQTGLGAILAGADEDTVADARRFGCLTHDIAKVTEDVREYADGIREPWSAPDVLDPDEIHDQLASWRREATEIANAFPAPQSETLEAIVAQDTAAVVDGIRSDAGSTSD